jgi:hypothetical protein
MKMFKTDVRKQLNTADGPKADKTVVTDAKKVFKYFLL